MKRWTRASNSARRTGLWAWSARRRSTGCRHLRRVAPGCASPPPWTTAACRRLRSVRARRVGPRSRPPRTGRRPRRTATEERGTCRCGSPSPRLVAVPQDGDGPSGVLDRARHGGVGRHLRVQEPPHPVGARPPRTYFVLLHQRRPPPALGGCIAPVAERRSLGWDQRSGPGRHEPDRVLDGGVGVGGHGDGAGQRGVRGVDRWTVTTTRMCGWRRRRAPGSDRCRQPPVG